MCNGCETDPKFKSAPNTPERLAELEERQKEHILSHGHQVTAVFPHPDDEDQSKYFAYTIGRSVFNKPELLITGPLHPHAACRILNAIAELENQGKIDLEQIVDAGEVHLEGFDSHLKFVRANPMAAEMFGAIRVAGTTPLSCIQVIWPDDEGNWPGEPAFEYEQPVHAQ